MWRRREHSDQKIVAERAAILCRAAEEACEEMPAGSPRPLYVIGTEVPAPGGEVAEGECPVPTKLEDVHRTLDVFRSAFRAHDLVRRWENVVGLVVQPAVEFGDTKVFDSSPESASSRPDSQQALRSSMRPIPPIIRRPTL